MDKKLHTDLKHKTIEVLYSWEAPERAWEPKDRIWFLSYSFFFIVIIAIGAIIHEYILIVAVIAFLFMWFVQASVPPEIVTHTITTIGIKTFGKLYKWKHVKQFWFSKKHNVEFLNLELRVPELKDSTLRISLIVTDDEDKEIFFNMIKYVDYADKDEIDNNFFSKLVHGKHVDVYYFLPKEAPDKEEMAELKEIDEELEKLKAKKHTAHKKK